MASDQTPFGLWLRQRRKVLDMTQRELAKHIGCSESAFRKFEAGARRPSRQMVERLADYFGLSPNERASLARLARAEPLTETEQQAQEQDHRYSDSPGALRRYATNLPVRLTQLIGRAQEVLDVREYLQGGEVRLVTLTGPPGVGKTRLGTEVATELLDSFPDGVFFVALAAIRDPGLVASTITQTLGLKAEGSKPAFATLTEHMSDKSALLLLDNFEQVIGAAPLVVDLLESCPSLKVLVTSREVLHVRGEQQFVVPSLQLPDLRHLPPVYALSRNPAVALFMARARSIKSQFALTEENAETIAAICAHLDGLPLAIELAAARINVLSPRAMLARLTAVGTLERWNVGTLERSTYPLLAGGARDLPVRHQAMHEAIAWSYDLLDPWEQTLFARLGIFISGCTLEAAEAICGRTMDDGRWTVDGVAQSSIVPNVSHGWEVFDGLKSLVDKSLVRQDDVTFLRDQGSGIRDQDQKPDPRSLIPDPFLGEPRFVMLETLREFAFERLNERGEADQFRRQHAAYYLTLAEAAEPELIEPQQAVWLERLEQELDNLRAAIVWALEAGDGETAARISGSLARFWDMHGHWSEGRQWLEAALANHASLTLPVRGKALLGASKLASFQDDNAQAQAHSIESLALFRELGDKRGMTESLNGLGFLAVTRGEYENATALLEESLALNREMGEKRGAATVLANLGQVAMQMGQGARAAALLEDSLSLFKELGDKWGIAKALANLGQMVAEQGDYGRATALLEESLSLHREVGNQSGIVWTLGDLGIVALAAGDYERSIESTEEALRLLQELGDKSGSALSLFVRGVAALYQEDYRGAVSYCTRSLTLYSELKDKAGVAMALDGLAGVAVANALERWNVETLERSNVQRAARLAGAAAALRETTGFRLQPVDQSLHENIVQAVRAALGEKAFAAAWAEGKSMTLEQAISYALNEADT